MPKSLYDFILPGKPLNINFTKGQIAALRFAFDEEFLALTHKSLAENLSADDIKKLFKTGGLITIGCSSVIRWQERPRPIVFE